MNKIKLFTELFVIFICSPLLIILGLLPKEAIMPVLWIVFSYAYLFLRRAGVEILVLDFERKALYSILKRFLLISTAIAVFVLLYEPKVFLSLVKEKPWLWLTLMFLYPILSAFIQEVLFRSFFFFRYEKLFKGHALLLIAANALLFSYAHIVFGNWIAVAFTFLGGILFAQTYLKTRSTLLTAIEHSLYGNVLFTLGLGYYFYHGSGS